MMRTQKYPLNKSVLLVFIFSLTIRISVVFGYALGFFNGSLKGADSRLYFEIARNLLNGNGFATDNGPSAFVSPLYPIFLAGCMSLFGDNLILISIVQSIMSALVCIFIFKITETTFNDSKIGLIAGIIAAIHFELILWSNAQLLTESLYVFLFAIAILFLIRDLTKETPNYLFSSLSGVFFALTALTRPTAIGIAFGIAVILIVSSFFKPTLNWKQPILFSTLFLIFMMPWGLRNYLIFDSFTISSLEGGHVLWLGNNPQYDEYKHSDFTKYGGYTVMFKWNENLAKKLENKSAVETNAVFANAAFEHIKTSPLAFIKRGLHKTWNMWRPNFSNSSLRNSLISYTFYPFILLTSLIGIFLAWRKKRDIFLKRISDPISILITIFLMHLFIHSVITGEIRFRVPLWVVLIPFSAYALSALIERLELRFFKKI